MAGETAAVSMTVNGKPVTADVDPRTLLVQLLREHLRLTGTHVGCDTSQCGACVVHVNGKAIKSCTVLALQLRGADVLTIEGLAPTDGQLHPMQEAFRENHGLQCGFCTPGMIMTAVDMVRRKGNDLDDRTIREELEGNICRCTGYHNIVKAIAAGAQRHAWRRRDRQSSRVSRPNRKTEQQTCREGEAMSATGIGAAVRRKEDRRFITGTGPLHRRYQSAGAGLRLFPSFAARARDHQDRSTPRPRPRCRACSRSSPAPNSPPTRSAT